MRLKVYADPSHYGREHRWALNDISKALWTHSTFEEARGAYGTRTEYFEAVDSPDKADLHLLTMKWPHYVELGLVDLALRAIEDASAARRPIAVFSGGDSDANLPVSGSNIHVFQPAGYRSRTSTRNHGTPAFFDDPLPMFCGGQVQLRDKGARAVIGFCGQAGAPIALHAARLARNRLLQLRWRLGREKWEPPPLEHTWFRKRIVELFQDAPGVDAKFVVRTKYRAGLGEAQNRNDPAQQARREFIDNVIGTDYTLCMRGAGNFSVRLYETLALGRIPVFFDTDCILPYDQQIDWRSYVLWVDENEVDAAPQIVARAHEQLSAAEFRERQLACRHLWEERLSTDGYYKHFHEYFPELVT